MKRQTFLWTFYFAVCAVVITAAIRGGMNHEGCRECHQAYKMPADTNKFVFHADKRTDTGSR